AAALREAEARQIHGVHRTLATELFKQLTQLEARRGGVDTVHQHQRPTTSAAVDVVVHLTRIDGGHHAPIRIDRCWQRRRRALALFETVHEARAHLLYSAQSTVAR